MIALFAEEASFDFKALFGIQETVAHTLSVAVLFAVWWICVWFADKLCSIYY